ncbi:DNA polymerase III subunit delta [Ponticoccus sp. SC2-23]|uniref:DNA polymerase III subunit delta n=1 Tax=Alexandriicola marinus TaxID=2081710 RepID=UPI000FDCD481|nr:DNA polymerase III subunit delta [Alexandriicola marinus]MBM1221853.1 DNA polymerase III subunit delta [Ponticoccus sp. SC6-9]MBM1226204.1 DNA polymerase III subunit delta [Ponticoccus sp. SC6-15]MBM1230800.1 DNA polymerase III subunit delta [Ponticoccus sp. SC6-38]MBM1235359.1 DNA polymerase III subunit delta [Ponticoccus sp. SC6-45]MBM1239822.1 DNA polymerase III subunit delta [Ponticoccus sp. SC6-49]MBM1243966.1 DNA polymerase III subunit delta [Ponticoccus sp. SC2-64]MBM1248883.1 DNA 
MKLSTRDASAYFKKPDADATGLLIYGGDAMRVALRRKEVVERLIGPEGEGEMRLTRISAAELRKDPALLSDAMRAQGFFPGARVALVEDAGDGLAKVIEAAVSDWRPGDAQVIVTAGQLAARSALRKLFEGHSKCYAVGIYDDPPDRAEIEGLLTEAGLTNLDRDATEAVTALSRILDPGDFRQTIEKLGLYMRSVNEPVTSKDVEDCAPQSAEAGLDTLLAVVADGRTQQIAELLRRLYAQGTTPVSLCIAAMRHFRALHAAASDPGGPASGIGRLRPPVFGPRRDTMVRQAQNWGRDKLERAVTLLIDTDLQLRSASTAPQHALVERALIRLSMMGSRGRS